VASKNMIERRVADEIYDSLMQNGNVTFDDKVRNQAVNNDKAEIPFQLVTGEFIRVTVKMINNPKLLEKNIYGEDVIRAKGDAHNWNGI